MPFEMLWQTKQELNDIYGNLNTQTFFLEQLLDEVKPEENEKEETKEEPLPELEHTSKKTLADTENELSDLIENEYSIDKYLNHNHANDRFIRKQQNTNQLRDTLYNQIDEENKNKEVNKPKETSLFDDISEEQNELPF